MGVFIDNVVGGGLAFEILKTHVMLFRLVAREDSYLRGNPHLAGQEPVNKRFAERTRAAGYKYSFTF